MGNRKQPKIVERNCTLSMLDSRSNQQDIKQLVLSLIMECFSIDVKKMPKGSLSSLSGDDYLKDLESHVEEKMLQYSTYFLIDHRDIKGILDRGENIERIAPCKRKIGGNAEVIIHPVDIYAVAIVEKFVEFKDQPCSIIHYLSVKRGYEGLGYARKLLKHTFEDNDLYNKAVYAVTQLPPPFKVNGSKTSNRGSRFFTELKKMSPVNDSACSDLIYDKAIVQASTGNQLSSLQWPAALDSSAVYHVDNDIKQSIVCAGRNIYYAKNSFFGWMKVDRKKLIDLVSKSKVELAERTQMYEIVLYSGGNRNESSNRNITNPQYSMQLPMEYHQATYPSERGGCVWLSMCQVLYNVDKDQSKMLVEKCSKNPEMFDFLTIFQEVEMHPIVWME